MKNQILILTISSILGTLIFYGLLELTSLIHELNNPDYEDRASEFAQFAIPDLGLILFFFFMVYPYQFLGVLPLERLLKHRGLSPNVRGLIIFGLSTFSYSAGFMIIFRSPYLGMSDTFQTFATGVMIFSTYFLSNLLIIYFYQRLKYKK